MFGITFIITTKLSEPLLNKYFIKSFLSCDDDFYGLLTSLKSINRSDDLVVRPTKEVSQSLNNVLLHGPLLYITVLGVERFEVVDAVLQLIYIFIAFYISYS